MVGGTHRKQTGHIHIVIGTAGIDITHPSYVVLLLQIDIHDKPLIRYNFLIHEFAELARLLIHLHCVYSIGRQILEHDFVISFEEVLAVEKKTLYKPAVHIYTSVRFKFCSGKLLYQRVKHRAFCQLKGVCIIYQRIILVIEFHFRGRNDDLIYLVDLLLTFHCHLWQIDITLTSVKLHIYRKNLRFVTITLCKQKIFSFRRNRNAVTIIFRRKFIPGPRRINHNTVHCHERNLGIIQLLPCHIIDQLTIYTFLFVLSEG